MVFPSRKPRALITGINGFTGRYMSVELRNSGYDVYGITSQGINDTDDLFVANLTDKERLWSLLEYIQPDVVVHLAAIAFVAHNNIEEMYLTNVVGTRYLLEGLARLEHKPKSVLLASSANVYGNTNIGLIDETQPFLPANDYAVSKVSMEYMARIWLSQLPITIVRPFNYTGVGQHSNYLLPKIVDHFVNKKDRLELGNLDVERDWSDVRDVVLKYRLLLDSNQIAGKVFNVCSSKAYSLISLIKSMELISGHSLDIVVNPSFVRANEVKKLLGDETQLRSQLSLTISRPLEETLQWMYQSALDGII